MKKWIIVILVVLSALAVGLAVPILMNSEEGGIKKVDNGEGSLSTHASIDKSNQTAAVENYYTAAVSSDNPDVINAAGNKGHSTPANYKNTPGNMQTEKPETTGEYTPQPYKNHTPVQTGSESTVSPPPSPMPTEKEEVPANWVEAKIQKYRDEIDESDLADFRRIFPKVDQGYLQNFANDGYTDEDIEQIKAYLKKTLGGDYERAKELFYRYNYLLSED